MQAMRFFDVDDGDGPMAVRRSDMERFQSKYPKAAAMEVFEDEDGQPILVRETDLDRFMAERPKAQPMRAFDVDGGEPMFVAQRDMARFIESQKPKFKPESVAGAAWQGFKEGALRGARDVAVNVAKGVASVPDVVVGTADVLTAPIQAGVSKLVHGEAQTGLIGAGVEMATEAIAPGLNRVGEKIDALHSEEYLADRARVNEAEGFRGTAAALLRNPHVAGGSVLESVTPMLMGGGIGNRLAKAAPRLAKVAGSIGEGLVAAGLMQESFRSGNESRTTTPGQSALAAGAGLATGLIGAASNKLGSLVGATDVESVAAGVATRGARAATRLGRVARGIAGTGLDAAEEMLQEPGEGIAENLGTGRPWTKLKTGGAGAAAGAAMAGRGVTAGALVASHVAAAREERTRGRKDRPIRCRKTLGEGGALAAMRANWPTPPPEMPTMPQDGSCTPPGSCRSMASRTRWR